MIAESNFDEILEGMATPLSDIPVNEIGDYAFNNCGLPSYEITNPDCVIADSEFVFPAGAIIEGYVGSTAQAYAEKYGLEFVDITETTFEMIADGSLDIIDICVPTPDHSKYALAALKAGKNVFCEKPVCRNIEQMVELREAVKDAKGFFNVGMCVRAWPEYNHAKELIASGAVGKVKSALFRRLSPSVDGNAWENWYMTERRSGGAVLDLL